MRNRSLLVALAGASFALSACGAPTEESEQAPTSTGDVREELAFDCVYGIKTQNGHYLTALNGGGLTSNAMASNRTQIGAWEEFTFHPIDYNAAKWAIVAGDAYPLTAEGGGNRTKDAIQTNRTAIGPWETFRVFAYGDRTYAFQTADGHFVTAVGGGGRTTDVLHTNATVVGSWEHFSLETVFCTP
jgi:hypothetical protein